MWGQFTLSSGLMVTACGALPDLDQYLKEQGRAVVLTRDLLGSESNFAKWAQSTSMWRYVFMGNVKEDTALSSEVIFSLLSGGRAVVVEPVVVRGVLLLECLGLPFAQLSLGV